MKKPKLQITQQVVEQPLPEPEFDLEAWLQAHTARVRRMIEATDPAQQAAMSKEIDGLFDEPAGALEEHDQWKAHLLRDGENLIEKHKTLYNGGAGALGELMPEISQKLALLEIEGNTLITIWKRATENRDMVVRKIRQAQASERQAQRLANMIRINSEAARIHAALPPEILAQQQITQNLRSAVYERDLQQLGSSPVIQRLQNYIDRSNRAVDIACQQARAIDPKNAMRYDEIGNPYRVQPRVGAVEEEPVVQFPGYFFPPRDEQ